MKLSFNGATTMHAPLETDIAAAAAAGFGLLEIWAAKLRTFLETRTTGELKRIFAAHGVRPYSINSIEHITFRGQDAYAKIKQECEYLSRIAAELGCPYVVVVPGLLPPHMVGDDETVEVSVTVLRTLAAIAEPHGVSLAFEFLGQTDCSVQTLALANEIVTCVDRSNIGMVLDSFHFYAGGSTLESIAAIDPAKLFVFHINDAEDRPREELNDSHRLFPGLGILPLNEIVSGLKAVGFDGVVSVEIFRPEYWERDPFEVAKDSYHSAKKVIEGASGMKTLSTNTHE
jgi:2-keto-myo-inositol isomerase